MWFAFYGIYSSNELVWIIYFLFLVFSGFRMFFALHYFLIHAHYCVFSLLFNFITYSFWFSSWSCDFFFMLLIALVLISFSFYNASISSLNAMVSCLITFSVSCTWSSCSIFKNVFHFRNSAIILFLLDILLMLHSILWFFYHFHVLLF